MPNDLHLNVPDSFTGDVYLRLDGPGKLHILGRGVSDVVFDDLGDDEELTLVDDQGAPLPTTTVPPAVEDVLRAFERYDPNTQARTLVQQLLRDDPEHWSAHAPVARDGGEPTREYVRLVFNPGRNDCAFSVLVNTINATVATTWIRGAAAEHFGAEARTNGNAVWLFTTMEKLYAALGGLRGLAGYAVKMARES